MPDNVTIAVIAKRASGKSYLTREILFHKKDIPTTMAISKTEKLNKFYGEFIPDVYIYDNYNSSILNRLFSRQQKMNDDNRARKKNGKKVKDDRVILIMDDCMSSKGTWVKEEQIFVRYFQDDLLRNKLRITVGNEEQNDSLIKAIERITR